jgi:hypothetical protein
MSNLTLSLSDQIDYKYSENLAHSKTLPIPRWPSTLDENGAAVRPPAHQFAEWAALKGAVVAGGAVMLVLRCRRTMTPS